MILANRYRVLRELGRGGMGAVYLAEHVTTGNHVALKVLHGAAANDPDSIERFRREARAPAKIGSESVVRVLDADVAMELGGVPFLAMEVLEGQDLQKLVRTRGRLAPQEVVNMLTQVARALDRSHAIGIVHRDLKPENLFLHQREDGTTVVKLLDFGISKLLNASATSAGGMTHTGEVMGTPLYMSPEQCQNTHLVTGKSDIYSLGVLLYEMVSGDTPFNASDPYTLLKMHNEDEPKYPRSMDQQIQAVIRRCLQKKPDKRYATLFDLEQDLAIIAGVKKAKGAGKDVSVLISRKPISPAKRKLLADDLGLSGGIKYIVGHCLKEDGMTTFALKTQVAGMAKRLKVALLQQTGLRVKVRCRGEDGETDEEFEEEEEGGGDAQARGGRDGEGDAKGDGDGDRDRPRHNREADDGDGERKGDGDGVRAKKPSDGDEDDRGESGESKGGDDEENAAPAAKPRFDLAATPKVWKGTREMLTNRIDSFVAAVKQQVAGEGDAFAEEVGSNLDKLNRILAKLDKRLTNTLTNAAETDDPASRRQLLQEAKVIIAEYIRYVRSEPLIDHLDNNPFGIKTNLKATLSASLTQVARAIG